MIQLTHEPIDSHDLLRRAQSPDAGAVLFFLGCTRQHTAGRETVELTYDAYKEMAEKELAALEAEARERWGLVECLIVHRLGLVPLGEASVAIVVASAHRRAAFEAGEWLIDTLKARVPIWKQEHWADGTKEWVHPHVTPNVVWSPGPCE
ncbi:MAG: molybdenum cofactor biosynthesis protein MoaE [Bythopirellula sp.]|nr:molybdenum cofactor biosynthesis protein MoaE [Bythopirellula sp.]